MNKPLIELITCDEEDWSECERKIKIMEIKSWNDYLLTFLFNINQFNRKTV